jgi:2-iminobutanoate/2-iminopropanoate deaminase
MLRQLLIYFPCLGLVERFKMTVIGAPVILPDGSRIPLSGGRLAEGFLFLSGQLGLCDGRIVEGGIEAQTHAAIDNIERLLAEAGLTLAHVVKSTAWLTDIADFKLFNATYAARFDKPYPARSTVVSQLLLPGALVEIEIVAARG